MGTHEPQGCPPVIILCANTDDIVRMSRELCDYPPDALWDAMEGLDWIDAADDQGIPGEPVLVWTGTTYAVARYETDDGWFEMATGCPVTVQHWWARDFPEPPEDEADELRPAPSLVECPWADMLPTLESLTNSFLDVLRLISSVQCADRLATLRYVCRPLGRDSAYDWARHKTALPGALCALAALAPPGRNAKQARELSRRILVTLGMLTEHPEDPALYEFTCPQCGGPVMLGEPCRVCAVNNAEDDANMRGQEG